MKPEYPIPHKFRPAIQELVHHLVARNFDQLVADGRAGLFTAEILKATIDDYGRTLTELPEEAWECYNSVAFPLENQRWAIDSALWTLEEGHSDLTLMLEVKEKSESTKLSIEDIRVR